MLQIQTFDARAGGNVLYKALAHPLAAEAIERLYARLRAGGPAVVYDPDGAAKPLFALNPGRPQGGSLRSSLGLHVCCLAAGRVDVGENGDFGADPGEPDCPGEH